MADGSAATPGSSTGKMSTVKDKQCPFCHQPFTSSSLGRHLDLYIKEKNAKPPDDVHDVEEIRKMRGGITRRQARNSSGKRESSTTSSPKARPFRDQRSPSVQKGYALAGQSEGLSTKTFLNHPNWQTTGVINDLPPTSRNGNGSLSFVRGLTPSRGSSAKEHMTRKQEIMEERDRGLAAELALKEVLESVKAANTNVHPLPPFDINFFNLTLPELYLQCLSPPPLLLKEPPTPHQLSWSLSPPDASQCEILRSLLSSKLHDWRRKQLALHFGNSTFQNGINSYSSKVQTEDESLSIEEARHYDRLSDVQLEWSKLSDEERQKDWHRACAQAFAREKEKHDATSAALERAEQEIQHLRSQLAQITQKQQRPEFTQYPTSTLPISRATVSHLSFPPQWSPDSFINKWKTRIQSARSTQHSLPPLYLNHHTSASHPNGRPHAGGDQRPQDNEQDLAEDEDDDLEDAPGEDDDGIELDEAMKGRLDPHLRGNGDDRTYLRDGDAGAGRMLMELGRRGEGGGVMDTEEMSVIF